MKIDEIDFNDPDIQDILKALLKEAFSSKKIFSCHECEKIFLISNKAAILSEGELVCVKCASQVLEENKEGTKDKNHRRNQVQSVLNKIFEAEHEYNELIGASRDGVKWENEIESRRLRIQTLKRGLLDIKQKVEE